MSSDRDRLDPHSVAAHVVLADVLTAAADDLALPVSRPLVEALAARTLELLALVGWQLVDDTHDLVPSSRPRPSSHALLDKE